MRLDLAPAGNAPKQNKREASVPYVISVRTLRESTPSLTMSLKVLRGNVARQIIKCTKNEKRKSNSVTNCLLSRCLATQIAPAADCKLLNSPWGEIQVGKETLTDYVFSDIELWADKPSVVIFFIIFYFS